MRAGVRRAGVGHDFGYRRERFTLQCCWRFKGETMKLRRTPPSSTRDESGASLILALIFVTSIAFLLTASLDFASASFRQGSASRSLRAMKAPRKSFSRWPRK